MLKITLFAFIASVFIGCGNNDSTTVTVNNTTDADAYVVFDSTGGDIPYPNNILFAATLDGTLNIPYEESDADASVKFALNTLDGFSTTSPISVGITGELNASTLVSGLKVYEINATASALTGGVPIITAITRDLTFGADYIATVSGEKIVVLPLKPLKSNQNYMIVLTKDIKDNASKSIAPDIASELLLNTTALIDATGNHTSLSDADATTFEGIRQATQKLIAYTEVQRSIPANEIVTAWSFKTQTIGTTAQAFATNNPVGTMGLQNTTLTSKQIIELTGADVSSMAGIANVYAGTLSNIPYYLAKATSQHDTNPLTKSFAFSGNALPDVNATINIPVLATVPNHLGAMPASGWPVVIFQHGITQNRTNVLAISEALANAGYAAVAIDLPLHGIDDNTSGLFLATLERTFDLDLANNSTGAAGPDGIIDSSGTHYINLVSLLTSRDNVRQTTSDLLALQNSFGSVVASDGLKFDNTKVAFVAHSLGTIASFGFLNHTTLESVTLAMPGGGIAQLLNNSVSFGPRIEAGLATKGVIKGTSDYASFMLATQTILDDADPLNYAVAVGSTQKILAIEVIGGQNGGLPDQVIPNNSQTDVDYAYLLYGTEPLLSLLDTTNLTATTTIKPNQAARFLEGDHSSILDPTSSVAATVEMQTQVATFVGSVGVGVTVTTDTLLRNP